MKTNKKIGAATILTVLFVFLTIFSAAFLAIFFGSHTVHAQTTTPPTYQPLVVTCAPTASTTYVGQNMSWIATVTGGNGAYNYTWTGSNGLTGIGSSLPFTYVTEGVQSANVQVVSGDGQHASATCSSVDVLPAVLTGYCGMSVSAQTGVQNSSQNNGQNVGTYTINWNSQLFSNVNATTTTYQWSGTNGLNANTSSATGNYIGPGTQTGSVVMNSANQSLSLACVAVVNTHPAVTSTNSSGSATTISSLSGSCQPSASGLTVTWSASASGGDSNSVPTYNWTSADGFFATSSTGSFTYSTDGTKTAVVQISSGDQSMALTCQARIASTTTGGGHCFIATAAYGTPLEPQVEVLRDFRDKSLETNLVGKALVAAYYDVSPPIADFIRDKESLKAVVRAGLTPVIFGLEAVGYGK